MELSFLNTSISGVVIPKKYLFQGIYSLNMIKRTLKDIITKELTIKRLL